MTARAWNELLARCKHFEYNYIIGETQTLTLWVYQEASDFDLAGAYAGSMVLGILSVCAFALAERSRTRATRKRNDLLTQIR